MSELRDALDQPSPSGLADLGGPWDQRVLKALEGVPYESSKMLRVSSSLSADQAWSLLSWAEGACSWAVRSKSKELLSRILQALEILDGRLDRRELLVVASLARRALEIIDGTPVNRPRRVLSEVDHWLDSAAETLPSSHEEVGNGESFAFQRKQVENVDTEALLRLFGQ